MNDHNKQGDGHNLAPHPDETSTAGNDELVRQRQDELETALKGGQLGLPQFPPGTQTRHLHAEFSGPLPPASMLADYERVVPGLSATIVKQWTEETAHRRELERREQEAAHSTTEAEFAAQRDGARYGCLIALAGFATTIVLASLDMQPAAAIIGSFDLVGLVGVFVTGVVVKRREERSGR